LIDVIVGMYDDRMKFCIPEGSCNDVIESYFFPLGVDSISESDLDGKSTCDKFLMLRKQYRN
jgi:hypothetical protein